MKVKIKQIENGFMPEKMRDGDACYDCRTREDVKIYAHSRELVPLGFALEVPEGYEALIRPRSGLTKKGIDCALGTVDSNYRGELSCQIINNSDYVFKVKKGDRICQLAIRKTEDIEFVETDILSESERGADGFGSSGI